jgi:hypothetical protein
MRNNRRTRVKARSVRLCAEKSQRSLVIPGYLLPPPRRSHSRPSVATHAPHRQPDETPRSASGISKSPSLCRRGARCVSFPGFRHDRLDSLVVISRRSFPVVARPCFFSASRSTLRLSPRRLRASQAVHLPALLRLPYAIGSPGGRLRSFSGARVLRGSFAMT